MAALSNLVLYLQVKSEFTRVKHSPDGYASDVTHRHSTKVEWAVNDKRPSLFCLVVSDEEKNVFSIVDPRCQCYKTFLIHH